MSRLYKIDEKAKIDMKHVSWICTGLIGISLIIFQDYISIGISDISILISSIAFSIAFPLLVGVIIITAHHVNYGYSKYSRNIYSFYYCGVLFDFIGINAAFWHLSFILGILFLVVSIILLFIFASFTPDPTEVERLQEEEAERERALE